MPPTRISQPEFIALLAMLFATIAFSIDAMLPAMGQIGQELAPNDPNRAQLIITSFVLGMGAGTFFAGPLSDAFGRKPVIIGGAVLYCVGAALAWAAQSLELALAARVLQGLGSAGPRIVSLAIIRDLYSGRQMARIVSLVMLIFTLAPAFAPSVGAAIITFSGWRGIFVSFIVFCLIATLWLKFRVPETLPVEERQPFQFSVLWSAAREVATHRVVAMTMAAQTFSFAALFAVLSSIQPIFEHTFDRGDQFHLWFMLTALIASTASILNAQVVVRLGMRRMVRAALVMEIITSGFFVLGLLVEWPQPLYFPACFLWLTSVFFMVGLTIGNLNAIALEPMGHVAGTAASVIGAISTVGSVVLAIPVALSFDGTPLPLAVSILAFSVIGYGIMLMLGARGENEIEVA